MSPSGPSAAWFTLPSYMRGEPFGEKVYEGPEADAVLVKLALERDGIRCIVVDTNIARGRLRGAVYVVFPTQVERARTLVARHLKGASVSATALSLPWPCPSCGERIEGQFQACWKCGTAKPA
jgi:hypothetical protein